MTKRSKKPGPETNAVESSADLRARAREWPQPVVVLFSRGKDAIAASLALKESGVDVAHVHMDLVPGLAFVDESLAELDRSMGMARPTLRLPHPCFYRWVHEHTFRPPEECEATERSMLWGVRWTDADVNTAATAHFGVPGSLVATGVRAADSPQRRMGLMHGATNAKRGTAAVVWDWTASDVESIIRRHGVRLPVDYLLWGRTFDGLDARFMGPMRRALPDDYERCRWWFPLLDADLFRQEVMR